MKGTSMKEKPKAVILFADLDGTFTPMNIQGKTDFINVVQEIQNREHVQVKFIPVSGRPQGYVLRLLHECRDMLLEVGVEGVCEFGAAEQGAIIVDSSRSYAGEYCGDKRNLGMKGRVVRILSVNEHSDMVSDEADKLYTCSIHIKNEHKARMEIDQQMQVYQSIRSDIEDEFGKDVLNISMSHNCMEVMSKEISKANGMRILIERYSATFNITAYVYAGDAENDKVAMTYMSKLAEIPGVNAHNFTPANAQDAINSKGVEPWKYCNRAAHKHYVEQGDFPLFKGIIQLLRRAMDEKRLCGIGVKLLTTFTLCDNSST